MKFGKHLQESQQPKRYRLHETYILIFFIMQIGKVANVFPKKNPFENAPFANIQNSFISSKWKVIATCADSYIMDVFFSCKRVINELTRTDITANCQVHINTHADGK